jgi:hypothetical protein
MELRNKKQKLTNFSQNRLQEIAKILINGICRLEAREKYQERCQNLLFPLDNKQFPSIHSTDINYPNQHNKL